MDEDVRIASEVTGLKLQMAREVDAPMVLGGFPKSRLDAYTGKLIRAGHSIAIALQDEQKGRHLKELIRVSKGMARYEHLPIFCEAYDLTVHVENAETNGPPPQHTDQLCGLYLDPPAGCGWRAKLGGRNWFCRETKGSFYVSWSLGLIPVNDQPVLAPP
jgi:hypothetical protein